MAQGGQRTRDLTIEVVGPLLSFRSNIIKCSGYSDITEAVSLGADLVQSSTQILCMFRLFCADESNKNEGVLIPKCVTSAQVEISGGCFWTHFRSCFSLNWASELSKCSGKIPFWRTSANATGGYSE